MLDLSFASCLFHGFATVRFRLMDHDICFTGKLSRRLKRVSFLDSAGASPKASRTTVWLVLKLICSACVHYTAILTLANADRSLSDIFSITLFISRAKASLLSSTSFAKLGCSP